MLILEDIVYAVERWLLWPAQDLFAGRRWAGGLVAAGVAAIVAGVLLLPGGGQAPPSRSGAPARVAIVPPPRPSPVKAKEAGAPTLKGVAPHFGSGGVAAGKAGGGEAAGSKGAASSDSGAAGSGSESAGKGAAAQEPAASASTAGKPVPAGPAAMKSARRFAEAFVFYEIGKRLGRAKTVFGETATEQLAKALEERPPRLPANGRVPKAKVLNLVPGPRLGKQYTVSVALLRVGTTSELRVTLEKEKAGEWRVASILG